jgi:hypothetical protein
MSHSSIGNMTNTQIETGSRHMQQCRTNYDVLLAMAGGDDSELMNHDAKYCMAKDELAISCGKHLTATVAITGTKYAYPSVITTLGTLDVAEKKFIRAHWHLMGRKNPAEIENLVHPGDIKPTPKATQFRNFLPVGYSVGKACAHGYLGDTVASVQIGGLRTVINGAFEIQTGDLIQMYLPIAENVMFKANGGRRDITEVQLVEDLDAAVGGVACETGMSNKDKSRRAFHSRGNGVDDAAGATNSRIKTGMFSIKPYVESLNEHGKQYYGDKIRVFARALSCARAYEPVDIMIARQSM